MSKTVQTILFSASLCLLATAVLADADLSTLQRAYQDSMVAYRQAVAQFDRDKVLYNRTPSADNQLVVYGSANSTFATRQQAVVDYTRYLAGLVEHYVRDSATVGTLTNQLNAQGQEFAGLAHSFESMAAWNKADNDFAGVYARLNETAYQSFAQVYWHELHDIVETFITLFQSQNQRILSEASNQVDRERKAQVLGEVERALNQQQDELARLQKTLPQINSHESYLTLRNELNLVLAQVESNLKAYASLE